MTKVLIDSSAWIHFFRQTPESYFQEVKKLLLEDKTVTCGLILTEVLLGARNEKEKKLLKDHFELLESFDLSKEDHYKMADLGITLRKKGLTVKTVDLAIGYLALRENLPLLHDDNDFENMRKQTSLKTIYLR